MESYKVVSNLQGKLVNNQERDYWFDNAKGILIIMVVIGHFIANVVSKYDTMAFLSNFIYSFHMPAFAIVSGYFMKRRVDTKDYVGVVNKTLIPYCLAQIFLYIIAFVIPDGVKALNLEVLKSIGLFSFTIPIYQLWYFLALFITFVYLVCVNAKEYPIRAFVLSVILSLVSGALPTIDFLRLTKLIAFLPFFVLGYIVPRDVMEILRHKKIFEIPAFVIMGISALVLWFYREQKGLTGIFAMTSRFKNFVFDLSFNEAVLVRAGFIIASIIISFSFFTLCPKNKTIFSPVGRKSSYVYVLHVVVLAIIRHFHYDYKILFNLETPLDKILYILFSVAICYALISKPVVLLFRKLIEPKCDIRNLFEKKKN